jgi:hypothetical protein
MRISFCPALLNEGLTPQERLRKRDRRHFLGPHLRSSPGVAMAAPAESTAPATRLSGTLGVGSIVFMVIAAAAPLTVIAGTIPLGVGAGNGAAFPKTIVH